MHSLPSVSSDKSTDLAPSSVKSNFGELKLFRYFVIHSVSPLMLNINVILPAVYRHSFLIYKAVVKVKLFYNIISFL